MGVEPRLGMEEEEEWKKDWNLLNCTNSAYDASSSTGCRRFSSTPWSMMKVGGTGRERKRVGAEEGGEECGQRREGRGKLETDAEGVVMGSAAPRSGVRV